ncbi:hypothetical protein K438DRAFT_1776487 [Mycena galopus ATCC 62051]|nr:hypothetical protein K438DRAFT_1776487 [Mycena galopus ATCC 62051]
MIITDCHTDAGGDKYLLQRRIKTRVVKDRRVVLCSKITDVGGLPAAEGSPAPHREGDDLLAERRAGWDSRSNGNRGEQARVVIAKLSSIYGKSSTARPPEGQQGRLCTAGEEPGKQRQVHAPISDDGECVVVDTMKLWPRFIFTSNATDYGKVTHARERPSRNQ